MSSLPPTLVPETIDETERTVITEATWVEIDNHYERGTMTPAQIRDHYGIKITTWKKHLERSLERGKPLKRGSRSHEVKEELTKGAGEITTNYAAEFEAKRPERLAKLNENSFNASAWWRAHMIKLMREAEASGNVGTHIKSIKAWEIGGKALENNFRFTRNDILDGKRDNGELMPDLHISNLDEVELEAIRKFNGDEEDGEDIFKLPEIDEEIVEEGE